MNLKSSYTETIDKLRSDVKNKLFSNRTFIANATVGIVDIAASTQISNSLDLTSEWELKEKFFASAKIRAMQNDIVILNSTGDGFAFIANYKFDNSHGLSNTVAFYRALSSDFANLLSLLEDRIGKIGSGLRMGVSNGPVIIGWVGEDLNNLTLVGPDINLAARLCAEAKINELVISARLSMSFAEISATCSIRSQTYINLKGFPCEITAHHIALTPPPRNEFQNTASIVTILNEAQQSIDSRTRKQVA